VAVSGRGRWRPSLYSCLQIDGSFLKKRTQESLFTCGARHHRHAPQPIVLGNCSRSTSPVPPFASYHPSNYHLMKLGCRRHIPTPLKEQMVIMHWVYQVPNSEIARLMDVHPCTVRRVVKKMRTTGSVVKHPLQIGPRRALNGVDCAVCVLFVSTGYSS
jgi:hypothetical protein